MKRALAAHDVDWCDLTESVRILTMIPVDGQGDAARAPGEKLDFRQTRVGY